MIEAATENIAGNWPESIDWAALAERAVMAATSVTPYTWLHEDSTAAEVSVRLSNDAEVKALNRDYRRKDAATNVLSFPQFDAGQVHRIVGGNNGLLLLGDIILAWETCAREADEKDIAVAAHAAHLIVHGMLHLLGYDHGEDDDAQGMEDLERAAMATMGYADPYRVAETAVHGDSVK